MSSFKDMHCTKCGAPITSEICPYCNTATSLASEYAYADYPEVKCKIANLDISKDILYVFSLAIIFLFVALSLLIIKIVILAILCAIPSIIYFVSIIKTITRFLLVKIKGKNIKGKVYGYNDSIFMKILVNTDEGPKFIFLKVNTKKKKYMVNSEIDLKVYKNIVLIVDSDIVCKD